MTARDRKRVREIESALDVIVRGQPTGLATTVTPIRELLDAELVWTYRPVARLRGWDIVDAYGSNVPHAYIETFRQAVTDVDGDYAWFGVTRPQPAQRNRVLEARMAVELARPGYFETTELYRRFFVPLRLARHHQLRVLLCDGPSLLAWFGTYQVDAPTPRQHRLLETLVPALRRRAILDRSLHASTFNTVALTAVLDQLGSPAFVLGARGEVHAANAAGRQRLDGDRQATAALLVDALAGRAPRDVVQLTELRSSGQRDGWLAVLPPSSTDARVDAAVSHARARWTLTARQTEVLRLLVRGLANATIADALGISERAVELHVTALLDRAGVDSRSALVCRVLAGST